MKEAKKKLSPEEQNSKMSVLKEIMGEMDGLMCDDLDNKKKMKVSVLADSKKGLKEGLDKAEDVVGSPIHSKFGSNQDAGALMNEEDYLEDSSLDPEGEEEMTTADIDQKIKELLALKEQKSVKTPY